MVIMMKIWQIKGRDIMYDDNELGTVGLTLGHTPNFCTATKCILILQMFFGRVGALTLIFATIPARKNRVFKLPLEKIAVG